nr:PREDICTED: dnaJ homolog subfamily C member 30-like [Linepithema humile]
MSYLIFNMHSALVQSSFKYSMVKWSPAQLYSTKQNMKSSKNHYNTLKITPHATQNEVKSAYYKLTLQYHPDKNKSEHAKQKFQDISEAYQVLSSHELRKNYDRRMMLYQRPVSATSEESNPQYKSKVYSGTSKIYNFDAWTQAHYGKQIYRNNMRKKIYEDYLKMEEIRYPKEEPQYLGYILLLFTIMIIAWACQESVDVPAPKKPKAKDKNND